MVSCGGEDPHGAAAEVHLLPILASVPATIGLGSMIDTCAAPIFVATHISKCRLEQTVQVATGQPPVFPLQYVIVRARC